MNSIWNRVCLCAAVSLGLQGCRVGQENKSFEEIVDVNPQEWICSNIISAPQSGELRIENGEYCIVGNDSVEVWTKAKDSIAVGQRVKVRVQSSALPKDVAMCEMIVGDDTLHFKVTTKEFAVSPLPDGCRQVNLGISGPDMETIGGPGPKWWKYNKNKQGSAVEEGLIPDIKPLINAQIRDAVICVGGDGRYYLTGSTGDDIWHKNDGVELWVSSDLVKWDYMGLVWSFEKDATWEKAWRFHHRAVRALWAPEIHYVKGNYFITYSMPPGDRGLLKSTTGKPEGPYVNALANDGKWHKDIDGSLFEDEDGTVYYVYGGGWIARMKEDMSGLAEAPVKPVLTDPDKDPTHHARTCAPRRDCSDIGHEGAFLFKRNGKYYLTAADTYEGRYSSMVAISDSIYGPYKWRHEAVPCGGGTSYFKDHDGNWWCTYFGNDKQTPFREMPAMVKVDFQENGMVIPAKDQPLLSVESQAQWNVQWEKRWKVKTE